MTRIVLFDLDHTLIPYDSGMAWSKWLIAQGHLEADFEARYLDLCHQYVAGTVDMAAMVRLGLGVLARHPADELAAWQAAHGAEQAAGLSPAARALVQQHQARGDVCCLATATVRFVAQPYAQAFGFEHFVATEAHQHPDGRYTGDLASAPNWGTHKRDSVTAWLTALGQPPEALRDATFYSDSYNDLPLLQAVGNPIVVAPDTRLRAHALQAGWPVIETL